MAGVGEVRKKALQKMGIVSVSDLLLHFPRGYQNRGDTKTVDEIRASLGAEGTNAVSVVLTVASTPTARMIRRGMNILKFRAFDEGGTIEITYFNQNYLKDTFVTGAAFRFWGKVVKEGGALKMTSPIFEPYAEGVPLAPLVPVYPLTAGISQKLMSSLIKEALEAARGELCDTFTPDFCQKYGICSLYEAYSKIHKPASLSDIEEAKRRLCFEEIFLLSASLASSKSPVSFGAPVIKGADMSEYLSSLPYELTGAQKRSLGEICRDMESEKPMRRILIGDVGSGKTAVAAGAAFAAVKSGFQCALMVPTEILARQHYEEIKPLFSSLGINVELLTGSTPQAEKKRILSVLAGSEIDLTGNIGLIIGTHALISDGVRFKNLGLVITDEQHRFGVMQRAALAAKAERVHTLVMSATPIPRTLSLVYYGDLSLSRLDEMPPGRARVDTFVVDERYRDRINSFIRTHARAGNRIYIVCPMVEENATRHSSHDNVKRESDPEEMLNLPLFAGDDAPPMKSAVEYARDLALRLPDLKIGLVHGKMKSAQKDAVMKQFCTGEIDVLVSTTVIEVGVNVPEATLMIVENAERFGLSQLHQLRGRVGRGERKSFCILISDSKSDKARERLGVMKKTYDGYEIAEADLKLRGAGDFLSHDGRIRQHGAASPLFFDISGEEELVERAVGAARELVDGDLSLTSPENARIKAKIDALRRENDNTVS